MSILDKLMGRLKGAKDQGEQLASKGQDLASDAVDQGKDLATRGQDLAAQAANEVKEHLPDQGDEGKAG